MKQSELARALHISQPMVSKLAALGMPTDSIEGAQGWRRAHLDTRLVRRRRREPRTANKPANKPASKQKVAPNGEKPSADARERCDLARARLLEMELAERAGELLAKERVRLAVCKRAAIISGRLLGLPTRLAPQLATMTDPEAIFALMTTTVEEILHSTADELDGLLAKGNGPRDDEAPPK